MDIYSVVAGGALAMAGGALTQWMTHIFSARREQHKLLREKAEMICEQLEELTRWVTERRAKALALEPDSETLPPFGKLVALQSLYFREASDEVQHFGYKAVATRNTPLAADISRRNCSVYCAFTSLTATDSPLRSVAR